MSNTFVTCELFVRHFTGGFGRDKVHQVYNTVFLLHAWMDSWSYLSARRGCVTHLSGAFNVETIRGALKTVFTNLPDHGTLLWIIIF